MSTELLVKRWAYPDGVTEGKIITDSEDSGVACRQFNEGLSNQMVDTVLPISAISSGRYRWNLGGQVGTWRSTVGNHTETISASSGQHAQIEHDSFTTGELNEKLISVVIP